MLVRIPLTNLLNEQDLHRALRGSEIFLTGPSGVQLQAQTEGL